MIHMILVYNIIYIVSFYSPPSKAHIIKNSIIKEAKSITTHAYSSFLILFIHSIRKDEYAFIMNSIYQRYDSFIFSDTIHSSFLIRFMNVVGGAALRHTVDHI